MATLNLTNEEAELITNVDAPLDNAFADGLYLPSGASVPGIFGYSKLKTDDPRLGNQKALVKNPFKTVLGALARALSGTPAYTNITSFNNNWGLWADPVYSVGYLRYYKDFLGIVHVAGLVKAPAVPGASQSITTLPVGYRPAVGDAQIFACVHNDAFCAIQVNPTGDIIFRGTPTANGWVSVNLQFKAGA